MDTLWTIEQLTALVGRALENAAYTGQTSARVRSVPDLRTIRYYTTLGLLAPPAMRGRKAYYGRRHVLQLVAIKRMQSQGMSLLEVQQAWPAADERALAEWAGLPADFWERIAEFLPATLAPDVELLAASRFAASADGRAEQSRKNFWATPTVAAPAVHTPAAPRPAVHVPVAENVELVLAGSAAERLDQAALRRLAPILQQLAEALHELSLTSQPRLPAGEADAEKSSPRSNHRK